MSERVPVHNLIGDANLQHSEWLEEVIDYAASIGTEINEHGYSHLVMPHALWDVLHTEVDANGDVVPQVRPVALQRPPALLPTANATQRAIWTTTDSKFTKETGYLVGMKRFILLGCGPAVTRLISQPGTGIRNLSCPDIIYQTGVLYGDASSTTIDKWTASLIVPYASADTFTTVLGVHNATHIK